MRVILVVWTVFWWLDFRVRDIHFLSLTTATSTHADQVYLCMMNHHLLWTLWTPFMANSLAHIGICPEVFLRRSSGNLLTPPRKMDKSAKRGERERMREREREKCEIGQMLIYGRWADLNTDYGASDGARGGGKRKILLGNRIFHNTEGMHSKQHEFISFLNECSKGLNHRNRTYKEN